MSINTLMSNINISQKICENIPPKISQLEFQCNTRFVPKPFSIPPILNEICLHYCTMLTLNTSCNDPIKYCELELKKLKDSLTLNKEMKKYVDENWTNIEQKLKIHMIKSDIKLYKIYSNFYTKPILTKLSLNNIYNGKNVEEIKSFILSNNKKALKTSIPTCFEYYNSYFKPLYDNFKKLNQNLNNNEELSNIVDNLSENNIIMKTLSDSNSDIKYTGGIIVLKYSPIIKVIEKLVINNDLNNDNLTIGIEWCNQSFDFCFNQINSMNMFDISDYLNHYLKKILNIFVTADIKDSTCFIFNSLLHNISKSNLVIKNNLPSELISILENLFYKIIDSGCFSWTDNVLFCKYMDNVHLKCTLNSILKLNFNNMLSLLAFNLTTENADNKLALLNNKQHLKLKCIYTEIFESLLPNQTLEYFTEFPQIYMTVYNYMSILHQKNNPELIPIVVNILNQFINIKPEMIITDIPNYKLINYTDLLSLLSVNMINTFLQSTSFSFNDKYKCMNNLFNYYNNLFSNNNILTGINKNTKYINNIYDIIFNLNTSWNKILDDSKLNFIKQILYNDVIYNQLYISSKINENKVYANQIQTYTKQIAFSVKEELKELQHKYNSKLINVENKINHSISKVNNIIKLITEKTPKLNNTLDIILEDYLHDFKNIIESNKNQFDELVASNSSNVVNKKQKRINNCLIIPNNNQISYSKKYRISKKQKYRKKQYREECSN